MLKTLVQILDMNPSRVVANQILQTISMMIHNLSSETSLYYLMSNNLLNDIISHKLFSNGTGDAISAQSLYKFSYDFGLKRFTEYALSKRKYENNYEIHSEETITHYISFLKSISMRLDANILEFFFDLRSLDFPLFSQSMPHVLEEQESMLRIACRTISLNIYRIGMESTKLRKSLLTYHAAPFFFQQSVFLVHLCLDVQKKITMLEMSDCDGADELLVGIRNLMDKHLDILYYFNDILELDIPELSATFSDQFLGSYVIPYLISTLLPFAIEGYNQISKALAIHFLGQVIYAIRNAKIVNSILAILFKSKTVNIVKLVAEAPIKNPILNEAYNAEFIQDMIYSKSSGEDSELEKALYDRNKKEKILRPSDLEKEIILTDENLKRSSGLIMQNYVRLKEVFEGYDFRELIKYEGLQSPISKMIQQISVGEVENDNILLPMVQFLKTIYLNSSTDYELLIEMKLCPYASIKSQRLLDSLLIGLNQEEAYDDAFFDPILIDTFLSALLHGVSILKFRLITVQSCLKLLMDICKSSAKGTKLISMELIRNIEQVCKELRFLTNQYKSIVQASGEIQTPLADESTSLVEFWTNCPALITKNQLHKSFLTRLPVDVKEIYNYRQTALNLFQEFLDYVR
jgi:hypothetical protein